MTILVTGGAGYIGSEVVERLDADDRVSSVLAVDSLSGSRTQFLFGGRRLSKTRFREVNILDVHEMASILRGVDVVIHAAAVTRHTQFYYEDVVYEQVNRWGTAALCNLLREPTSSARRLIYLSTTSVYGKDAVVGAGAPPAPSDPYAISKYEGEHYVLALSGMSRASGGREALFEPVVLRLGQVFGYNACVRTDTVVNSLIVSALQSGQVHIYGQGNQRKLFASLDYVAERVVEAALGEGRVSSGAALGAAGAGPGVPSASPAAPLNLFQYELSVLEVVDLIERALGAGRGASGGPGPVRPLDRIHVSRDLNYGSLVSNLAARASDPETEAALTAAVAAFQSAFRL